METPNELFTDLLKSEGPVVDSFLDSINSQISRDEIWSVYNNMNELPIPSNLDNLEQFILATLIACYGKYETLVTRKGSIFTPIHQYFLSVNGSLMNKLSMPRELDLLQESLNEKLKEYVHLLDAQDSSLNVA